VSGGHLLAARSMAATPQFFFPSGKKNVTNLDNRIKVTNPDSQSPLQQYKLPGKVTEKSKINL